VWNLGRLAYPRSKGTGDQSMPVKRESAGVNTAAVPPGPRDMVKARLPEVQFRSAHSPARRYVGSTRRHPLPAHCVWGLDNPRGGIPGNDPGSRNEWTTYIVLETYVASELRDRLRGASPMVTEPQ